MSIIVIQVHAKLHKKLVHFYMRITLKHKRVVEKFVKNMFYGEKHSFIELTYVVEAYWNCLVEAFPMCTRAVEL